MHEPLKSPARVLIVDDNRAIHDDISKILRPEQSDGAELRAAETALFGENDSALPGLSLDLSSAYQGAAAIELVEQACQAGRPYAMAFMDVRMPPGLDGIETTTRLWQIDPDLQVVLCTAYSDYGWSEIRSKLGHTDNLVILKKPFDNIEVLQLAHAMTEKWRLGRQARARLTDLEQMVGMRTAELSRANEELRREVQERKQAEEALRRSQELVLRQERLAVVGQLSAGVAHSFNNIMTIIQGHASLLGMSGSWPESVMESIQEIEVAADRAARLTRQLLAFSCKQVIQTRTVDPAALVSRIEERLSTMLGGKSEAERQPGPGERGRIVLQVAYSLPVPPIVVDPAAIEQALTNLVLNARDAMPRGGRIGIAVEQVSVDITAAEASRDAYAGEFVLITVRDSGCGMDARTLQHLFEPFFTTKDVGQGVGLGLATAYGIIKQHQGWIEASSVLGQGSTFKIFLPTCRQGSREL